MSCELLLAEDSRVLATILLKAILSIYEKTYQLKKVAIIQIEVILKDNLNVLTTFLRFHYTQIPPHHVMHRIKIIDGATKNILDKIRSQHPEIPWKDVARMRDILIHTYVWVEIDRV